MLFAFEPAGLCSNQFRIIEIIDTHGLAHIGKRRCSHLPRSIAPFLQHPVHRRYVLLYQDQPGSYRQRMLSLPDGEYFAEELISDRKLGRIRGETLRTKGILLDFPKGASPLQILRFTPMDQYKTKWSLNYPELN